MRLHEILRELRVNAGLSQHEVSEKVGVSQATVSNWEAGRSGPSPSQIEALERFLGPMRPTVPGDAGGGTTNEISPFGVWLNTIRTRRRLTPVELAGMSGVSAMTIYNLESGRSDNPQKRTRESIVRALGERPPAETVEATEAAGRIEGLGDFEDFDPHDQESLPEGAGVYVFYDISERPIYVGQSKDVRRRMREHRDMFWFKSPVVEHGAFISIADAQVRMQVEKILIKFLKSNAVLNRANTERK